MDQVIIGGYFDLLDSLDTEYNSLSGGFAWTSVEANRNQLISTDGVIKNFRGKLSAAPGVGNKYTFTLMLNGAPTALTFDITDDNIIGSDMVHEVDVAGGNTVSIQCVPDSNPTSSYATWTSTFKGDTAKESLILGGSYIPLSKTAIEYIQLATSACSPSVNEDYMYQVCPTAGTLKNFFVKLSADPGAGGDAYRLTVRKGLPMGDTALTVTITEPNTTGSDLVNTVDVAAGDVFTVKVEPLNEPDVAPAAYWGVTFEADVDGESIILGGTSDDLHNSTTEFNILQPGLYNSLWDDAEIKRYQLGQVCTVKKLYIVLSGPPGAGKAYTFTVRIAGANSNVVAVVADAATTGNSGVLEDTVANDEYMDLQVVPTSVPTIKDAYWGLVCYIEPPAPPAGGMGAKPPIMELLLAGVID